MAGGNDKGTEKAERDATLMNDYKRDRYREKEKEGEKDKVREHELGRERERGMLS